MKNVIEKWAQADKSNSNLTSMIDIVFLLLIFFLCATQFPNPEAVLKTWLPENGPTSDGVTYIEDARLILRTNNNGCSLQREDLRSPTGFTHFPSVTIQDWKTKKHKQVPDWKMVQQYLQNTRTKWNKSGLATDLPVTLDFKADVPMKYVAALLDTCKAANTTNIAIAFPEKLF